LEGPNADVCQALSVHGAKGKQVLHQVHQRGKADLLPLLEQLMTRNAAGEYLLLLHQSAFSREDLNQLLRNLSNPSFLSAHFFGGGNNYLYYDAKRDTGLLGQRGSLAHRIYFDGVRSPDMFIDGELDPMRFKQVWRHYFYQCKRRLFEIKGDVLRHLTGSALLQHQMGTTSALLKTTQPALLDRLQTVLRHIAEHYVDEERDTISQLLGILNFFLSEQEVSEPVHIHELNNLLSKLLDSILEPAY